MSSTSGVENLLTFVVTHPSTALSQVSLISQLVSQQADKLKLIVSGRVIDQSRSLAEQGVKNNSTVMIMLLQDQGRDQHCQLLSLFCIYIS